MPQLTASACLVLGLLVAARPARADDPPPPERHYLYYGVFGGTCGEGCGGVEIFSYHPGPSKVLDYFGFRGGMTKVGGLVPIIELSGGMNIAHPGPRQHVQLGVVAGAYFFGARTTAPTETEFGVAAGVDLAYSYQLGRLHLRPALRAEYGRGEVGSTAGTGTGKGPLVIADVHAVLLARKHLLLFGHVGYQRLSLSGKLDHADMTATYEVSSPYLQLGVAF